jgi:hypothetical protein
MEDLIEIKKNIEKLSILWEESFKDGNHKMANKYNAEISKIIKKIKKDKELCKSVLSSLLSSPNPSTRLMAAVHALDQNVWIQESEEVLKKIAGDPAIRLVRLMAQIHVHNLESKKTNQT